MAVKVTTIKTVGRLVFNLTRDGETTTRQIEIPYAEDDSQAVQEFVNQTNATFTNTENNMNYAIQPANWRDNNDVEAQWTTTGVRYEIVTTSTTPVEPDEG